MLPAVRLQLLHAVSRILHRYADWRIGATKAEKCCYKSSDSILLTFDDYGSQQEVDDILAILAAEHVKTMIFPCGDWAEKHPDLIQKIRSAGHILGNHTYTHPNLLTLSDAEVEDEIRKGLSGRWLRAPQGRVNQHIRTIAQHLGFSLCYWTIDSRDWTGASVTQMRHTILSELHPGAVILFHMHGLHTQELLPGLIHDIRARGYVLTGLAEKW